ncbi:MAG: hypothetical protein HZC42_02115 [Candidatus Eisenbacteria bacterium]|nr:hypothetical protein [Candidatus Eisenbacteria bacterium]
MKVLQSGGFQHHPLMRLTLGLALLLLAGFWVTNLALYFRHMSLDPASVASYYRGNDTEFMPPRSAESMLEVTHMHLAMFALVLLLLTHLLIFAPLRTGAKAALVLTAFLSALLSEAAGWMTRFWHPGFAMLKVAMFVLFQGTLLVLIVGLGVFLAAAERLRRRRHAARHHPHEGSRRDGHAPR